METEDEKKKVRDGDTELLIVFVKYTVRMMAHGVMGGWWMASGIEEE